MAEVISAVRSYILAQSSVTDLIAQRLYLFRLPQNPTLPAATIAKVSGRHEHTLADRVSLQHSRMQVECHSTTFLGAEALAKAIYECGICALRGTTSSVFICGVTVEDGQRNYVIDARDGGDDHQYVTQFDFMVSYRD